MAVPKDKFIRGLRSFRWPGSVTFWNQIYARGGHSGAGSYGPLSQFKAEVVNQVISDYGISSAIEFGCGDGNQLSLIDYPRYVGLDLSVAAIRRCISAFGSDPSKSFFCYDPSAWKNEGALVAELGVSLDVIFHLVEDDMFEQYMENLFEASARVVVIYSSNSDDPHPQPYMKHRLFADWVAARQPLWTLVGKIKNRYPFDPRRPNETSYSDFWIYERKDTRA